MNESQKHNFSGGKGNQKVHVISFYLCKIQEQTNLIYDERVWNSGCF